ncbi:MAG: ZIP family metal transporter [Bacilli bacterium]
MDDLIFTTNPYILTLVATLFTWFLTLLGSALVFLVKNINPKKEAIMMGLASGVMIAASFWSLIIPGINIARENEISILFPIFGIIIGVLFIVFADSLLEKQKVSNKKNLLLFSAITLHNIPEGLVIGVAFAAAALGINGVTYLAGAMLALGIGIQNLPEGAAISLPLKSQGVSSKKAFHLGHLSASVEIIAGLIGVFLVTLMQSMLPFFLCFAAGAMIGVVLRELLPDTIMKEKNITTISFLIGFCIMMFLDVILG